MSHQPFETWIFEDKNLSRDEQESLRLHLESCTQCKCLLHNWKSVEMRITHSVIVAPLPNFSQRWQSTLKKHLEEQKMRQILRVRQFFLFLGLANLLSLILLLSLAILGGSANDWVLNLVQQAAQLVNWLDQVKGFIYLILQIIPPSIPIILWVLATSGFAILAFIWIISFWRISLKGVFQIT